jgi:hypothetical protein
MIEFPLRLVTRWFWIYRMTSDHRVTGSSPARCKGHNMNNLGMHFGPRNEGVWKIHLFALFEFNI